MSDVALLVNAIEKGDPHAARKLFPLVYDELRTVAAVMLAQERPGHTLGPTSLVHEVYLRLMGTLQIPQVNGQQHFFAVAAESMRRILVDHARSRNALKRGAGRECQPLDDELIAVATDAKPDDDLLALDDALNKLAEDHPRNAELVKLRYFAGLTLAQASEILGISSNTADRWWAFSKAYLYVEISRRDPAM